MMGPLRRLVTLGGFLIVAALPMLGTAQGDNAPPTAVNLDPSIDLRLDCVFRSDAGYAFQVRVIRSLGGCAIMDSLQVLRPDLTVAKYSARYELREDVTRILGVTSREPDPKYIVELPPGALNPSALTVSSHGGTLLESRLLVTGEAELAGTCDTQVWRRGPAPLSPRCH